MRTTITVLRCMTDPERICSEHHSLSVFVRHTYNSYRVFWLSRHAVASYRCICIFNVLSVFVINPAHDGSVTVSRLFSFLHRFADRAPHFHHVYNLLLKNPYDKACVQSTVLKTCTVLELCVS